MSRGIKELKELIIKLKSLGYTRCDEWLGFIIIEKELKRLEELDNGAYVSVHINRYNELCDKEEALEIIKNKKVDIKYLYYRAEFNLEKYNDNYIETLTKEECDLLKEIFNA